MKAPVNRNPRKFRYNANQDRPNGANLHATSSDEESLLYAAMNGNRATRRLAMRNLKKKIKATGVQ